MSMFSTVRTLLSRRLAAVAVGALIIASCGSDDPPDASAEDEATDLTTTSGPALPDSSADAFDTAGILSGTVPTVDGASFDLADARDSDLVVWFWAPW